MSETTSAREGALAKLAEEAARFSAPTPRRETPRRPRLAPTPAPSDGPPVAADPAPASPLAPVTDLAPAPADPATDAGYVPVAVAPERGNTRPVVPVDGRLHMRVAQSTLDAVDALVRDWKADRPDLRDLERATLVRIGLAMVLADVRAHGRDGAVGEAVAAALDPRVRHTATPMPDLGRWVSRPAG